MASHDMHDAGGKVKTRLPGNLRGDAVFAGDRGQFRPILRRWLGPGEFSGPYALFIGMNPSTASAEHNDPTITREWGFCEREGFSAYVKCNVSDYRATNPKDLLRPGLDLSSPGNRQTILEQAKGADLVIACWGRVNRALAPLALAVEADLEREGITVRCFGRTQAGHPRHPLFLAKSTPLQTFLPR